MNTYGDGGASNANGDVDALQDDTEETKLLRDGGRSRVGQTVAAGDLGESRCGSRNERNNGDELGEHC